MLPMRAWKLWAKGVGSKQDANLMDLHVFEKPCTDEVKVFLLKALNWAMQSLDEIPCIFLRGQIQHEYGGPAWSSQLTT
jgi:hypothetical protein